MSQHGLSEIRLRDGEQGVCLRKGPLESPPMVTVAPPVAGPAPAPAASPAAPAPEQVADSGLVPVVSPMVGTFYAASDPESPPFVSVGSEVDAQSTVCVIEAMKVFNEIRAEVSGRVERILVHNEQAVEYGQPLMLVRPRGQ